jgi:uncharacterized membrane protein
MSRDRLEAFSDGVIAILITIMVLELEVPDDTEWSSLRPVLPVFLAYLLSFVNLGIYWNNHHHMIGTVQRISGAMLWANLHLLFWLSLFPFTTAWMGEHDFATVPAAAYGIAALGAAIAYFILQNLIISDQGSGSKLAAAIGRDLKGKVSPVLYVSGIALSFVNNWIGIALYAFVAVMWLVPDRRIEKTFDG